MFISYSLQLTDSEFKLPAKLPRIWWCPTGPLAFLPIHAAGKYIHGKSMADECLSDFAVSSYIPNVNFLHRMSEPNSVKKSVDAPNGMLIISQSNTPGQKPIPCAADEGRKVSSQLGKRGISHITLDNEKGTTDGVLRAMEAFSCIHLACHASQHITNPLKSSIYLHDGQLDLSEVMKKNFTHSDFAFLSACQTSAGDENLPEEAVHLASGMLAAGYRSVVGTMWSILDKHGPDLAEFFYESLLDGVTGEGHRVDGAGAARALHNATSQFRENLKISDSPDSLLAWVPYIHIGI